MEVIENSIVKVVLPREMADTVVGQLENSEILADKGATKEIAVYWGQHEAQRLAKVLDDTRPTQGFPEVPAPISRDYDWPGVFSPFAHQRATAAFLSLRPRGLVKQARQSGRLTTYSS